MTTMARLPMAPEVYLSESFDDALQDVAADARLGEDNWTMLIVMSSPDDDLTVVTDRPDVVAAVIARVTAIESEED